MDLAEPIVHVGQVAELAYTYNIGYQITAKFAEPGQIWITGEACRAFGIDVDSIAHRDRAKSLRQLTEGIDFVTLAVAEGWSLGGAGEDPKAHRLGTWTRVYRDDKRGVMVALIPGMGEADEMPIFADEPTPAQVARRLQLLADALRFPWKINAGVTAVDLMLQTRTKAWSPQEWRDVVLAPSTTAPPFGIGMSNATSTGPGHPPVRKSNAAMCTLMIAADPMSPASPAWSSRSATRSTIPTERRSTQKHRATG